MRACACVRACVRVCVCARVHDINNPVIRPHHINNPVIRPHHINNPVIRPHHINNPVIRPHHINNHPVHTLNGNCTLQASQQEPAGVRDCPQWRSAMPSRCAPILPTWAPSATSSVTMATRCPGAHKQNVLAADGGARLCQAAIVS